MLARHIRGVAALMALAAVSGACDPSKESTTEVPSDRAIAAEIHKAYENREDFALVTVLRRSLLVIDVTPGLYANFMKDPVAGRRLVEGLTRRMQVASRLHAVEVRLYATLPIKEPAPGEANSNRQLFASGRVEAGKYVVTVEQPFGPR
jgi:hypothetical protein